MNPKKNGIGIPRREFLTDVASSAISAGMLSSRASRLIFSAAIAHFLKPELAHASTPTNDMVFVNFFCFGGLVKWVFDLPLTPNTTDSIPTNQINPYVGTQITPGTLALTYNTVTNPLFQGIRMPSLWGGQIPTNGGGSTAIANLTPNLLMIRGINELFDSHEIQSKNQLLLGGQYSITGLMADVATTPFPACSYGDPLAFNSKRGLTNFNISRTWTNPLETALGSFKNDSLWVENSSASLSAAIDSLLNTMKTVSASKHERLPLTYDQRAKAKQLILTQFGDLQNEFNTRRNIYKTLLESALRNSAFHTSGLDTVSVPGLTTPGPGNIDYQNPNSSTSRSLLSRRLGLEKNVVYTGANFNAASVWANATIPHMAEGFAIAEFMITKGLTSSLNISLGGFAGLSIDNSHDYSTNTSSARSDYGFGNTGMDMHDTGSVIATIAMTRWYRAYLACMNQFINVLKNTAVPGGGNIFQRTVIANTSEFNRSPRVLEDGSDHGWAGQSYSLFSGMIESCQVLGNVAPSQNTVYPGIWGFNGKIAENNNRELLLGNVASTLATLLNIPSPSPNESTLVNKVNGVVASYTIPRGKNVA
ncbi:MAG: hypothetical protein KGP28_00390 [Bdellovibrionales bacterium]|nr:hypothetical protein [Bdellovibrionales bacterium]